MNSFVALHRILGIQQVLTKMFKQINENERDLAHDNRPGWAVRSEAL